MDSSDSTIRCNLEILDVDAPYSNPRYSALSYTWVAPAGYGRFMDVITGCQWVTDTATTKPNLCRLSV